MSNLESTSLAKNNWFVLLHGNYNLSEDEKCKPQVTHFLEVVITFFVFVFFPLFLAKDQNSLWRNVLSLKVTRVAKNFYFSKAKHHFLSSSWNRLLALKCYIRKSFIDALWTMLFLTKNLFYWKIIQTYHKLLLLAIG